MQLSVPQAVNYALALSLGATDAVTGNGSLDVLRYGQPLRSRMLVGVRGAGLAYDGLYYVNSVTQQPQARPIQAELLALAGRPRLQHTVLAT